MSIAEIRQLLLSEEVQIMEASWEDLRNNAEAVLVPNWQKKLLHERRTVVEEGREQVLDGDEVKHSLGAKSLRGSGCSSPPEGT